ncbi:MAG: hypothetical protein M3Y81_19430 [Chloroflexota bacterium]|nr:hypothetical protein [Chloroflexota bacterium]
MRIGPDGNANGGRDLKTFPVERMRKAAGDIVSNANSSLAQHEATWRRVQGYIDSFPGFMQGPVRAVLSGYDRRLRESYQWQIDYATSLAQGADAAGITDADMAQAFNTAGGS